MNTHKNARLTFARRLEMVQDVLERKLTFAPATETVTSTSSPMKYRLRTAFADVVVIATAQLAGPDV